MMTDRSRLWRIVVGLLLWGMISESRAVSPSENGSIPSAASRAHLGTIDGEPTRAPAVRDDIGSVTFAVTTLDPRASQFVRQGVVLLLGLSNLEAERSFRQAARYDPRCAMAYWGIGMANLPDEKKARGFVERAAYLKDYVRAVTTREGIYINGLKAYLEADPRRDRERREAYVRALESVLEQEPGDREARVFLARQLRSNREAGVPIGSTVAADSLLKLVLSEKPGYPCHLERVLLWESDHPTIALDSARKCGPSTPGCPAAWHAPGHLYERLNRPEDAAWQYEAAVRVDRAEMARLGLSPTQLPGYVEHLTCLARALAKLGRSREAMASARELIAVPRHPRYNVVEDPEHAVSRGRDLLVDLLTRFEHWDDLIAIVGESDLWPAKETIARARRLRAEGRARIARGDAKGASLALAALRSMAVDCKVSGAGTKASPGAEVVRTSLRSLESKDESGSAEVRWAVEELEARAALARGDRAEALRRIEHLDGLDPIDRARMLREAGRAEDAENALAEQVQNRPGEVLPMAALIEARWNDGRRMEAEQAFVELREATRSADLDAPPLARLAPIARALGYPADWRLGQPRSMDTGDRPALETLGPATLTPRKAANWTLKSGDGSERSLADYRGRPVIVIFYLGAGCLHCVQQLEDFAPRTGDFAKAGIDLIGVSTDDRETLARSLRKYGGQPFPFPLVSDSGLDAFRAAGAFDPINDEPLHGTFLIGPEGTIRWQDTGHEPFDEPEFLLQEARRLLGTTDRH